MRLRLILFLLCGLVLATVDPTLAQTAGNFRLSASYGTVFDSEPSTEAATLQTVQVRLYRPGSLLRLGYRAGHGTDLRTAPIPRRRRSADGAFGFGFTYGQVGTDILPPTDPPDPPPAFAKRSDVTSATVDHGGIVFTTVELFLSADITTPATFNIDPFVGIGRASIEAGTLDPDIPTQLAAEGEDNLLTFTYGIEVSRIISSRFAIRALLRGYVIQAEELSYRSVGRAEPYSASVGPISSTSLMIGLGIFI